LQDFTTKYTKYIQNFVVGLLECHANRTQLLDKMRENLCGAALARPRFESGIKRTFSTLGLLPCPIEILRVLGVPRAM